MIKVENAHGLYVLDTDEKIADLNKMMKRLANASEYFVREQASGAMGYPNDWNDWTIKLGVTPLDDVSILEVFIMWIESGNYTL